MSLDGPTYVISAVRAASSKASQEEITLKVEMEYRLFLAIDMSLYRHRKIFFGGCAKFRPLAFLQEAQLSLVYPTLLPRSRLSSN